MARERKFSLDELFKSTKGLLLSHGYEGFTFSILANQLEVSRGTIYKYYENKDELITAYMIDELKQFLQELEEINQLKDFEQQFEFLMNLIFKNTNVPKLIRMALQIPNSNKKVKQNKHKLDLLHLDMYHHLQGFIENGRNEHRLKPHIPDGLILGFIFQTIAIPNHDQIPHTEWVFSIKEIIRDGMFSK